MKAGIFLVLSVLLSERGTYTNLWDEPCVGVIMFINNKIPG